MNKPMNELPSWDLSDLYQGIDDPQVKIDLEKTARLSADLVSEYQGKLSSQTPEGFLKALKDYEQIDIIAGRLMEYAFLQMCTRTNNQEAMAFYQNTNEAVIEAVKPSIFFTLEINQLSNEKLQEYLQDPQVAHYQPWLEMVRIFKPHELSQEMEELLADKSMTSSAAWTRLYEETSANLIYTVDGKKYNQAEIYILLQDKDPEIRAKAGREINRKAKENSSLFGLILNTLIKDKAITDQKRGYPKPVSERNLSSRVDDSVVKALGEAIRRHYPDLSHRFYALKAHWLGQEKIQYWDRNAPLPFCKDQKVEWDQAVKTVLEAYDSFSPRFKEIGAQFFDHPWIDVPPRPGKQSGAFCAGTGGMPHPYLLLNFQGKENDVMTLAHELGHGCHHILCYPQGDLNDQTPKTLAEVASVFAEMVTFQKVLNTIEDDKAKLCLIADKVASMLSTVHRQMAFHFVETRLHDERKKGELSVEQISKIWVEELQGYLGPNIIVDEDSAYTWTGLSHIYEQPFYVYAYAFADCLVNSLYQVYRDNTVPNFADKYLHMLSETGIKGYEELLKPFGLDAHDPKFWDQGMRLIGEYIDELERLNKKLGL